MLDISQCKVPACARLVGLFGLLLTVPVAGVGAQESTPAHERFADVLEAVHSQPEAEAARLEASARRLDELGVRRSGPPTLEWQSEGLGGGGREPNAADSLRLGQEFSWPGQRRALSDLAEVAAVSERSSIEAKLAALRLRAGRLWLELAALADETLVYDRRAARLDRAVTLHEKRYELGEVAGAEVTQLALERARDEVERRRIEARSAALDAELARLAGDAPRPLAGDLEALLEGRSPVESPSRPAADPFLGAAEAETLRAEQLARLDAALAAGRPAGELEVQRIPSVDGSESFESFSLQLSVPLTFGEGVRERRAAAEARADLARASLEVEKRLSRARARTALDAARAAEAGLASLAGLLAELPRTEHSLAEQFRLGAISYVVYLDGLDRLDQLSLDAARARGEAARARFELAVLGGDSTIFPLPPSLPPPSPSTAPTDPEPSP